RRPGLRTNRLHRGREIDRPVDLAAPALCRAPRHVARRAAGAGQQPDLAVQGHVDRGRYCGPRTHLLCPPDQRPLLPQHRDLARRQRRLSAARPGDPLRARPAGAPLRRHTVGTATVGGTPGFWHAVWVARYALLNGLAVTAEVSALSILVGSLIGLIGGLVLQ